MKLAQLWADALETSTLLLRRHLNGDHCFIEHDKRLRENIYWTLSRVICV